MNRITNLDKTIQELTNRLDEVHPYSASSSISNYQNSNDGVNYWKGKKIIPVKDWNDLYKKNSIYTDTYKIVLTSRKPLHYFPEDYNGSISSIAVVDEKLKEEIQNWNKDYYELLEYRKNPTLGRKKCSKCLLSGSSDDPIFVGIEKVFARIVSNQCNNNITNANSHNLITYHCNIMNIFSCPFESKEYYNNRDEKEKESKYPYKREELFALHQISFAIEQAITTFFEITKQNEIIYEVDFVIDRVQEIHTKYNGEPESWGWNDNVNDQLLKVKPISDIVIIRDKQDIYNILTNREKLEYLLQEYEKQNNHRLDNEGAQLQVCCDENTPCVPNDVDYGDYSSHRNGILTTTTTMESLDATEGKKQQQIQQQQQEQKQVDYSHKGENPHSKNTDEQSNELEKELNNEHLKPDLKEKIKEELEKSNREQQILLKQYKQNIIDFLSGNKDSIRVEDLKIYEPIYKCYRQIGNCQICKSLTNIICTNCSNYNNEVWLCVNHWQQHSVEKHKKINGLSF